MSTLAFEPATRRRVLGCALCAAGCAAASAVYQAFGHGVTSRAMTWAFLVPLLGLSLIHIYLNAREEFIRGNLRLVLSVIQRFSNRGENVDDLFQVGCIGPVSYTHLDVYKRQAAR